jgi:hypothetical protein
VNLRLQSPGQGGKNPSTGVPQSVTPITTAEELHDHRGVGHVTLQVETDPATAFALEPDQIV